MNHPDMDISAAAGLRLRLVTNGRPSPVFGTLLGAYLIQANRVEMNTHVQPHVLVRHRQGAPCFTQIGESIAELGGDWGEHMEMDILHLMASMARRWWHDQHLYAGHAACVVNTAGDCTLLVGTSGSGKTSTALHAVARGAKLVGGDRVLIGFDDGMQAIAGTQTLTLRADMKNPPALSGVIAYGNRIAGVLPDSQRLQKPIGITRIALTRVAPRSQQEHKRILPTEALHILYPLLLDRARSDVVVANGAGVYTDTHRDGAGKILAFSLAEALKHIPMSAISGSASWMAERIFR